MSREQLLARIQKLAFKRFCILRVPRLRRLMFWLQSMDAK